MLCYDVFIVDLLCLYRMYLIIRFVCPLNRKSLCVYIVKEKERHGIDRYSYVMSVVKI